MASTIISPALQKQLDRWYPLKEIPIQMQLIQDKTRFIVIPGGRRSGKTERFKRKLVKACMHTPNSLYFAAAPTYAQAKKIFWQDLKMLALTNMGSYKVSESDLIIKFPNNTELHVIGLDKPSRIEGIPWDGGGIDECAYVKDDAWALSIAPALDTYNPTKPDSKPWCWLLGKPDGRNWYYDMYQYACNSNDPEWAAYTWPSSILLDEKTIDAAKRRMSLKQFRQEYEASFETMEGRIYEDYCSLNHTHVTIQPTDAIHYFCDFNYNPMSHGLCTIKDDNVYISDEIILEGATSRLNALEFVNRYKDHLNKKVYLYGDPSGRNGEKWGLESQYIELETVMRDNGWDVERCVSNSHPPIRARQDAVRAKVCTADGVRTFFVNPETAPWIDKACSVVCLKKGSSFLEDDKDKYQHITTAFGYMIHYKWPVEKFLDFIDVRGYY